MDVQSSARATLTGAGQIINPARPTGRLRGFGARPKLAADAQLQFNQLEAIHLSNNFLPSL